MSLAGELALLVRGVERHGDYQHWQALVDRLPRVTAATFDLSDPVVRIGSESEAAAEGRQRITDVLRALLPWRKGPFQTFGTLIDAEWRSDRKWRRLEPWLAPLAGRRVLDVGSGNGYYCLRALGAGAEAVLGIDPSPLFVLQFEALRRLLPPVQAAVLPLTLEQLPSQLPAFDSVLSMGVLYHRRNPLEHLTQLKQHLRSGGELVLETLVLERAERSLYPAGRYANMRNVFCIPTLAKLQRWLEQSGFLQVRVVDVTPTTTGEQRPTQWMPFHSLAQALDPNDPGRTREGYPAPTRAIALATRP